MNITPRVGFEVSAINTEDVTLICLPNHKTRDVKLAFDINGQYYLFAQVVLHDGSYNHADAAFNDATKLGDEIVRRWNECQVKV